MPFRPPVHRPCAAPTRDTSRRLYDDHRGPSHLRGYDWAWRRCRRVFLARHPLCQRCEKLGLVTEAREVHHIVPIEREPSRRLDHDNLMAVCSPCHRMVEHDDMASRLVPRVASG